MVSSGEAVFLAANGTTYRLNVPDNINTISIPVMNTIEVEYITPTEYPRQSVDFITAYRVRNIELTRNEKLVKAYTNFFNM